MSTGNFNIRLLQVKDSHTETNAVGRETLQATKGNRPESLIDFPETTNATEINMRL